MEIGNIHRDLDGSLFCLITSSVDDMQYIPKICDYSQVAQLARSKHEQEVCFSIARVVKWAVRSVDLSQSRPARTQYVQVSQRMLV